jgi:hypothetical protein
MNCKTGEFKDGPTMFTMKSIVAGRPSVGSDDLVHSVDLQICEARLFAIPEILCEFPQTSSTLLYEIITVRVRYPKFGARVTNMLTGEHKLQMINFS